MGASAFVYIIGGTQRRTSAAGLPFISSDGGNFDETFGQRIRHSTAMQIANNSKQKRIKITINQTEKCGSHFDRYNNCIVFHRESSIFDLSGRAHYFGSINE